MSNLSHRLTKLEKAERERLFARLEAMTDAELEALVADGPDLSGFSSEELEALLDGTASDALVARFDALEVSP